ncbi:hypothetical protein BJY00DRAFT_314606 [Aspergillus carlsbadensis]|nr:hypothetical protein BJY00DRAFT_314606 [Aspergillus carlsbadensis]
MAPFMAPLMAPHLPLEILHMVAANLESIDCSLTPCILVCRSWRAAFEPLIYSKLRISTTRTSSIEDKRVLPLDEFDKHTSNDGHYDLDNPVRQENDMVFQEGIARLFTLLCSWSADLHVSLELSLHGEELCVEEPETCEALDTREFDYELQDSEGIVPPYHAAFVDKSHVNVPEVACIKRLSFPRFEEHQIGAAAALEIVSCCSEITDLELAFDCYIRPDHIDHIQGRRLGVWLMNLTPEGQAEFDAITDMTEAIYIEESAPRRRAMDLEGFHRIFISLGYAPRQMPRLKQIYFSLGFHVHNDFTCLRSGAGTALKWWGGPYSPDDRVASAWGFRAESWLA